MINNSIKFKTNIDKSIIPPPSGEWTADSSFQALIKVTPETILIMYPLNDRDSKVSTEKPRKYFFQENKNVIKVEDNSKSVFVKAFVVKRFGQEVSRPATILYQNIVPVKGHCTCAKCQLENGKSVAT